MGPSQCNVSATTCELDGMLCQNGACPVVVGPSEMHWRPYHRLRRLASAMRREADGDPIVCIAKARGEDEKL